MDITFNNFAESRFLLYSKYIGIGYSFINTVSFCPNTAKTVFKCCICFKKVDKVSKNILSTVCPNVLLSKMDKVGQSYLANFVHEKQPIQPRNAYFWRFGQKDTRNSKKNPIYTF